ncbi:MULTISPECIES: type II toxin-antitoxin system prevent-host-death family antitoxin [Cyanophyceae]|uniref:type II toxin-antitoxin system prevent-host-death family antitoxin n=1 Tax=Cyanophyceae TaxID=3028117 RepID=UPI00074D4BE0|nr:MULTISPECIES: type II toxin-antitoxin system prevent-host-death family antitoxin [Cyanophyceae]MBF2084733.1 type II toxin-antitoxin system Phd/YefM family antitoxin [Thermoleptolyngbya sp. C42_A2020_037]BAU43560.1 Phd_YefM protein [Leptolyngbya sp. O-77]
MINVSNIYSLTDFKRNAKEFVERIRQTNSPLVLTVNGKAEVVVQDAKAFQEMVDRLRLAEAELQQIKLELLQRDLALGTAQLDQDEASDYDDASLPLLRETIRARGERRLKQARSDG